MGNNSGPTDNHRGAGHKKGKGESILPPDQHRYPPDKNGGPDGHDNHRERRGFLQGPDGQMLKDNPKQGHRDKAIRIANGKGTFAV